MKNCISIHILIFLFSTVFCKTVTFYFDGPTTKSYKGYLTSASTRAPLILFLDGSTPSDAYKNHHLFHRALKSLNAHLITIEKPGNSQHFFDEALFYQNDSLDQRHNIHMFLYSSLKQGLLDNWNQKIVLIGVSEGGKLAAKLAVSMKEHLDRVIIINAGGGLAFEEEITYQITNNYDKTPEQLSHFVYALKKNAPCSTTLVGNKSTLWWHNLLSYNPLSDLLKINSRILLIHGVNDPLIPVQSADVIASTFMNKKKKNLTYYRLEHTGHALTKQIFNLCLDWLTKSNYA